MKYIYIGEKDEEKDVWYYLVNTDNLTGILKKKEGDIFHIRIHTSDGNGFVGFNSNHVFDAHTNCCTAYKFLNNSGFDIEYRRDKESNEIAN